MFETLTRKYKQKDTKETIEEIKSILENIELILYEKFYGNPYPEIYSVRLELDEKRGNLGTNGKGRTKEYSLASGYAEFIERLQNNLLITFSRSMLSKIKVKYGFFYFPDEKYLDENEILELPSDILEDLMITKGGKKNNFIKSYFKRLYSNNEEGAVSVPFYDTKNMKVIYIPLNLLIATTGSNGMAAGNDNSEAVYQALCELMERWSAAEIFHNQITPPTISEQFLSQFKKEYEIIKQIEKEGKYKVLVKDFSANKRIPSVGIIIINKKNNKYRLNVGSDTSFQVALSRCLTEVYQGSSNDDDFDKLSLDIPKDIPSYFLDSSEESLIERLCQLSNFTKNGTGVFPPSLFDINEDYEFDPTVYEPKYSYDEEVKSIISNIHDRGYNVYIRDNSFLEFPTVFVYIPEISAFGKKFIDENMINKIEIDKIENLIFNFDNCSEEDLKKIEEALSGVESTTTIAKLLNIKFSEESTFAEMDVSFFLTLLRYSLGKYQSAIESLEIFMKDNKEEYYELVYNYINYKKKDLDNKKIYIELLNMGYEKELVEQVCEDMSEEKDIFKYISMPKCPNCDKCHLKSDCITSKQVEIFDKVYEAMLKNRVDQKNISSILI